MLSGSGEDIHPQEISIYLTVTDLTSMFWC